MRLALLAREGAVGKGLGRADVATEDEVSGLAALDRQLEGLQRGVGDVVDAGLDPPPFGNHPAAQDHFGRPAEQVGETRAASPIPRPGRRARSTRRHRRG